MPKLNATATNFTVPPLGPASKVRARQRVGSDESEWSNVARAEEVSLPPLPPAVESLERAAERGYASAIAAMGGPDRSKPRQ